jgi:hypothetical protein
MAVIPMQTAATPRRQRIGTVVYPRILNRPTTVNPAATVNPEMFACLLFLRFSHLRIIAKIYGREKQNLIEITVLR